MTFRAEDELAASLKEMIQSTGKDKSYLINFAIRMLCEAGGPDGLFIQKVKATMMESIGFDDVRGLLDIIDSRVAVLAGLEPGSLGQDGGPRLVTDADLISPSRDVPQVIKEVASSEQNTVHVGPQDPITTALEEIYAELVQGVEPLLDNIAAHAAMDKALLATALVAHGVKTTRARREGKRNQYFLTDQLPAVKKALGIT